MPADLYAACTRPEQSKARGPSAPKTYGLPSWALAYATTFVPSFFFTSPTVVRGIAACLVMVSVGVPGAAASGVPRPAARSGRCAGSVRWASGCFLCSTGWVRPAGGVAVSPGAGFGSVVRGAGGRETTGGGPVAGLVPGPVGT